jgi:hypothetical protein
MLILLLVVATVFYETSRANIRDTPEPIEYLMCSSWTAIKQIQTHTEEVLDTLKICKEYSWTEKQLGN